MTRPTGFPRADVENDFLRARRRQVLARLAAKLRREPDDVNLVLPFDEVVAALGQRGEQRLGLQTIKLASIVGSVDSTRDFDRQFRPTSSRVRARWERLALAQRRGEAIPPIEVYRVGDLHFVKDGHHRVSIAMASGLTDIDAYVTEVRTAMSASGHPQPWRLVGQRATSGCSAPGSPCSPAAHAKIEVSDPWSYAELGEAVEAWGFRCMQHDRHASSTAMRWPAAGSPRSTRPSCACCGRPTCSVSAPTPRPTCGSPPSGTASCAPTNGTTRSSTACGRSRGLRSDRPATNAVRFSPLLGSKTWIARASAHSSRLGALPDCGWPRRAGRRSGRRCCRCRRGRSPGPVPRVRRCDTELSVVEGEVDEDVGAHGLDDVDRRAEGDAFAAWSPVTRALRPRSSPGGCRADDVACTCRRTPARVALRRSAAMSPRAVRSLPFSSVAGMKFIAGEPMKPATKRLAGLA